MDEFVKSDFGIKLIKQFNHFMFERVEDSVLEQLYQSSIQESVHKRVKEKIENVTRNSPLYRGL
ncbi:hypothetical protein C8D97_11064 [Pleionea mediterranea]|uniref:Uncharacterized protein n=1 Tax=Pleionea mediterranea TaxID=523701 RepID=A0A316FJ96_9GAMM|nr:hypothetical protein C8D97_11064 [Pleionea mediterranea]